MPPMTCEEFRTDLQVHLDEKCPPNLEHCQSCPECAAWSRQMLSLEDGLRELKSEEFPALDLRALVRASLPREPGLEASWKLTLAPLWLLLLAWVPQPEWPWSLFEWTQWPDWTAWQWPAAGWELWILSAWAGIWCLVQMQSRPGVHSR